MPDKEKEINPFEQSQAIDQIPRNREDFLSEFFSLPPDFFEIIHSLLLWMFLAGISSQTFLHLREYLGRAFWLPLLPLILLLVSMAYCQKENPEMQTAITIRLVFVSVGVSLGVM